MPSTIQSRLITSRASTSGAGINIGPGEHRGRERVLTGSFSAATLGELQVGDFLVLAPLPSGSTIVDIEIANDDLDTLTNIQFNLGLYRDANASTAILATAYASQSTLLQAAAPFTDQSQQSRPLSSVGFPVWQDGSLGTDPLEEIFLAMEIVGGGANQAGAVSFRVNYVID